MNVLSRNAAAIAALVGLLWMAVASPALADIKDYEFQLVQTEMKKGDGAIVAVRLINKKTSKPVPDAVIFAKRIDMAPDGMATMDSPLGTAAVHRAGRLPFQDQPDDGGPLAAFARRQGPGRGRHGRDQAGAQGAAMSRTLWAALTLAAIAGGGGRRLLARRIRDCGTSWRRDTRSAAHDTCASHRAGR